MSLLASDKNIQFFYNKLKILHPDKIDEINSINFDVLKTEIKKWIENRNPRNAQKPTIINKYFPPTDLMYIVNNFMTGQPGVNLEWNPELEIKGSNGGSGKKFKKSKSFKINNKSKKSKKSKTNKNKKSKSKKSKKSKTKKSKKSKTKKSKKSKTKKSKK